MSPGRTEFLKKRWRKYDIDGERARATDRDGGGACGNRRGGGRRGAELDPLAGRGGFAWGWRCVRDRQKAAGELTAAGNSFGGCKGRNGQMEKRGEAEGKFASRSGE